MRNVVVEQQLANTPVPRYRLFDLAVDPGEKNDEIDEHPEVAGRFQAQLEEIIENGRSR